MRVRVLLVDGRDVTWSTEKDGIDTVAVDTSGALQVGRRPPRGEFTPVAGYGLGYWAAYEVLPDE